MKVRCWWGNLESELPWLSFQNSKNIIFHKFTQNTHFTPVSFISPQIVHLDSSSHITPHHYPTHHHLPPKILQKSHKKLIFHKNSKLLFLNLSTKQQLKRGGRNFERTKSTFSWKILKSSFLHETSPFFNQKFIIFSNKPKTLKNSRKIIQNLEFKTTIFQEKVRIS